MHKLDVLSSGWPRAYFFREAERHAVMQRASYEEWSRGKAEQVKLIAVQKGECKAGAIRVLRAQFGTQARAFTAGRAYAAAHVSLGPFSLKSNLVWVYNFSTTCPRDAQGRNCNDVLAADLTQMFSPGGKLAAFDGVEFDVMRHSYAERGDMRGGRSIDAAADGKPDGGYLNNNDVCP